MSTFQELKSSLEALIVDEDRTNAENLLREAKHSRIDGAITRDEQQKLRLRFKRAFPK